MYSSPISYIFPTGFSSFIKWHDGMEHFLNHGDLCQNRPYEHGIVIGWDTLHHNQTFFAATSVQDQEPEAN